MKERGKTMKGVSYVMNELNSMNLMYIHNAGDSRKYYKEGDTLYIHPVENEYQAVLDHLDVNPSDIKYASELEQLVLGRMDKNVLQD